MSSNAPRAVVHRWINVTISRPTSGRTGAGSTARNGVRSKLGHDGHQATGVADDQRRDVVSTHDPRRLVKRCLGPHGDRRPEPEISDPRNDMAGTLDHELITPQHTRRLPGPNLLDPLVAKSRATPRSKSASALSSVSSASELVSTTAAAGQGSWASDICAAISGVASAGSPPAPSRRRMRRAVMSGGALH